MLLRPTAVGPVVVMFALVVVAAGCGDEGGSATTDASEDGGVDSAADIGGDPDAADDLGADTPGSDAVEDGDEDLADTGDDLADAGDGVADLPEGPDAPFLSANLDSSGDVVLTWGMVPDATSYVVYWADESGVTPANYDSLLNGSRQADVSSPLTLVDLTPGADVYFVVTAADANGEGPHSNEVSETPFDFLDRGVLPLYATNGSDWNQWVQDDGPSLWEAAGDACPDTGAVPCLHAGELRLLDMPEFDDCEGVTGEDELGVLVWRCLDDGEGVRLVSTGLPDGAHLSILLDFGGESPQWRPNRLSVRIGENVATISQSSQWWQNTIETFDAAGTVTSGSIGVVTTSHTGDMQMSDSSTLVTAPGILVGGVVINARDFVWVEAGIDHNNESASALRVFNESSNFIVVDNTRARNVGAGDCYNLRNFSYAWIRDSSGDHCLQECFDIQVGQNLHLSGIAASQCQSFGIGIQDVDDVTLTDATSISNDDRGVLISDADRVRVSRLTSANNEGTGIEIQGSNGGSEELDATVSGAVISDVLLANNSVSPMVLQSEANNVVLRDITAVNHDNDFLLIGDSNDESLQHILILNLLTVNNEAGFRFTRTEHVTLADSASVAHSGVGLTLVEASEGRFAGSLVLGLNDGDDCDVTDGTNPGIDNECAGSDATLLAPSSAADFFVGPVGGTVAFDDVMNWETGLPYVAWGLPTAGFPNGDSQGACDPDADTTCQLWDWSLSSADTSDDGSPSLLGVHPMPALGTTATFTVLADVSTCPADYGGTWNETDAVCEVEVLLYASEIYDDSVGDEDALCEAGEHCLYTPNIGVYQGHGALEVVTTLGTGEGSITIWAYSENGVD